MEAKHTPGPWFLNERYDAVTNKDGEYIAMLATDCGDPIAPEDLKLIAAAPELLDALQELVKTFNPYNQAMYRFAFEQIKQAEQAIKKATE